jgi:hypothetical protein
MNIKGILLAVVVLALMVGCTWAAPEAGFAVVPDNEAGQIVGGFGYQCTGVRWPFAIWNCGDDQACDIWVVWFAVGQCAPALSGECDDTQLMLGLIWGDCAQDPDTGACSPDGSYWEADVYGCQP